MSQPIDPIQKAVDDYLLMEAKARAWDELREWIFCQHPEDLIRVDALRRHLHQKLNVSDELFSKI